MSTGEIYLAAFILLIITTTLLFGGGIAAESRPMQLTGVMFAALTALTGAAWILATGGAL